MVTGLPLLMADYSPWLTGLPIYLLRYLLFYVKVALFRSFISKVASSDFQAQVPIKAN